MTYRIIISRMTLKLESKITKSFVYDSSVRIPRAIEELIEAWRYRDLIFFLIRRDVTTRYKRSVLGIAWTMLHPLGMMIVLSVVFSQVFRVNTPGYPGFVLSGLIAWNFFSQVSTMIINALVWGGDLYRKIYVPRSAFAISAIGTGLVNLMLSLVPLIVVMAIIGIPPHPTLFLTPFAMVFLSFFTLGIGLLISTIGVYFIDVVEMYAILLMAWMYLTPIIYSVNILSPEVQLIVQLNPMMHLVSLFRNLVFHGVVPPANEWLIASGISVGSLLVGWLFFTGKADEFAYRT